ncbi:hypothetical protein SAMN04489717_2894 [Actinopolymorpha singaporensis]|uniref:Uncharacterized protein n=1 Tax=Actinopolymorpha singaporensis TaxID=117157 RepID=A0A1H1SQ78_9ACTN|nr:hypothetical protein SAMN04489717_2894 [Actinopolymorpha singaporensis]
MDRLRVLTCPPKQAGEFIEVIRNNGEAHDTALSLGGSDVRKHRFEVIFGMSSALSPVDNHAERLPVDTCRVTLWMSRAG